MVCLFACFESGKGLRNSSVLYLYLVISSPRLTFFVWTDEPILKLPVVMGLLLTSLLLRTRGQQNALKFITYVHGSRFVISDLFLVSASVSSWCTMFNVHISISSPHQLSAKSVKIKRKCRSTLLVVNASSVFDNLMLAVSIHWIFLLPPVSGQGLRSWFNLV